MQKWAIILFLFVALAFWARAQEIVVPVPAGTLLPSSYRYIYPASWFTDANAAGVPEGAFGLPTDDTNHMFVLHLHHWRQIILQNTYTP